MNESPQPPTQSSRSVKALRSRLLRYLRLGVVIYLLLVTCLVLFEERLVFLPTKHPQGNWQPSVRIEDVSFESADGTKLHGWYAEHPNPQGYLLYCHGNAGNVTHRLYAVEDLRSNFQLSVFVFDYRGYGRSEGSANEEGVLQDGRAAQRWLAQRAQVPVADLFLLGRSLGGGVAVDLAAQTGAKGLILQNTFDRLPNAAASHYWYVPVRLLMRTRFASADKIGDYQGPLLQCHGTEDKVVPYDLGKTLFTIANEPKQFVTNEDAGHESMFSREYFDILGKFIERNRSCVRVE